MHKKETEILEQFLKKLEDFSLKDVGKLLTVAVDQVVKVYQKVVEPFLLLPVKAINLLRSRDNKWVEICYIYHTNQWAVPGCNTI